MAQPHNKKLGEYPMTTRGREQGPEKRYRRLRFPAFTAAKWTAANPLLQRGELGVETDTRKIKVGDGITYWNDLEYAKAYSDWGNIAGDITEQTDLVDFVNAAVAAEANIRSQADQQLQANIDNVATDLSTHEQDTGNPHNVTKAQVGLGNVDNTSDIDKPVSTAQATAINNAVSEHNTSDTAHGNLFSQYRTSESQDNIDSNLQSQITNNDTDITNLQNTKADKATTLAGYGITDAYTKTEVDAKVSSVYRFRGSVATYANLPTTEQVVGDVWNVEDTGANYAWSGSEWDKLSETVDLTPYLTKTDAANTYATLTTVNGKQDTLTTDQLAAVNSGITADHVASYDAYAGEISAAQSTADKADNAAEAAQQTANLVGQEAAQALSGLTGKVNIAQGTANAGKLLGVGDDGNVAPVDNPVMGDYVIYWDSADTTDHSHAKPGVATPTDHGWYRVYKSGWCEQGGRQNNTSASKGAFDTVYLYIPMKDKNYSFSGCFDLDHADSNSHVVLGIRRCRYSENDTPEKAIVATTYNIDDVSGATGHYYDWEVKGWAA